MKDLNIVIVGAAGEGVQTVGDLLAKTALACGYCVFTWQEYESRIRGGYNRFSIRIGENVQNSPLEKADILVGLNRHAIEKYHFIINKKTVVIGDGINGENMISMDFAKIAREELGDVIYGNTIAAGAAVAALSIELERLFDLLDKRFSPKGDQAVRLNRDAAQKGYEKVEKSCINACPWKLDLLKNRYYNINTTQAIAIAAAYAGCRFISAYPMTPSTGVITYLAKSSHLGVFTEQAEDEIAAVNMALGANYAGIRAMTATAGGGFALMVESVSLSGMIEVPLVIVVGQRPGPATGLPTRTSQADLLFVIHAGHGEFPKVVLAPSDPLDAFQKTVKAFNMADKYQVPVIILTSQYLADSTFSFKDFPFDRVQPEKFIANPQQIKNYKRYAFSGNGISPRLYPGQSNHLVTADSDEHDEYGHITEDLSDVAVGMVKKRLAKMKGIKEETALPEHYLVNESKLIFVGWGSTRNIIMEAIKLLKEDGIDAGMIHFTEVWPLPDYKFAQDKQYYTVEENATGQLGRLLCSEYSVKFQKHIARFDGLPLTAEFIRSRIS